MTFIWQPEMIRFMRDASEYGDYYQQLAQVLLPELQGCDSVCDAGCGLGYLSLVLSKYIKQVTAVDRSAEALAVLRQNCATYGIDNVHVRCADMSLVNFAQPFDAAVFCMYGQLEEIIRISGRICSKKVLIVKRDEPYHRFSKGRIKKDEGKEALLMQMYRTGLIQKELSICLPFHQPFRSLEDARSFLKLYSQDQDAPAFTDEYLLERLVKTGNERYPYEMPGMRRMTLLTLEADVLRQHVEEMHRNAAYI